MTNDTYSMIYTVVGSIPSGKVSSYGRIAKLAECGPRQVGYAMSQLPTDTELPWHRVVNSKGEISLRDGMGELEQRDRLQQEGIVFNPKGRINLKTFGWPD